ncbi:unnamed protein product [Darwinula stevensoni]|uniref:Ig-like domain-containing protein n=1 Tax=Darwinula stevensoni TaxID=69355 RepID=A0A7R9ADE6_9CRUS|nr:unnamed protein product [Darwinula stevensoni]CAG0901251.1 unnamed protein product [Darwinula stevensoni]
MRSSLTRPSIRKFDGKKLDRVGAGPFVHANAGFDSSEPMGLGLVTSARQSCACRSEALGFPRRRCSVDAVYGNSVEQPSTEIRGSEEDIHVAKGSSITLTCVVRNYPKPPDHVTWFHGDQIINHKSPRGGVIVETEKGEMTTSMLVVLNATPHDSGIYKCRPSNAKEAIAKVHVHTGHLPSPMQIPSAGGSLDLLSIRCLPLVILLTSSHIT